MAHGSGLFTLLDKLISLPVLVAFGLWGMFMVIGMQGPVSKAIPWMLTAILILVIVLVSQRQDLLVWMHRGQGLLSRTLHILLTTAVRYPRR